MLMEQTFGILTESWRILFKLINMPLQNVYEIVIACTSLHNMCIIYEDEFDTTWARKEKGKSQTLTNYVSGDFQKRDTFHIANATIRMMQALQRRVVQDNFVEARQKKP